MALAGFGCLPARGDNLKPRVIVFVHGIHGNRETWRAPNGAYWPQLLQTDPHFQNSDVVVAEYPTPSVRGQYSTTQLAQLVFEQLRQKRVWEHREVVFVAHSLGGILTEELLLNHPTEAARVRFVVAYATPHQGSFVASLAKIYDSDPLLTDLSASNDNNFLMNLEQRWRSAWAVARIHRYCAFETRDTPAGTSLGKYLHAQTRVVSYYSATYGCDTDTPPQRIEADHIEIARPAGRWADAYTFFSRVYHNNPILTVVESVRDAQISALNAACHQTNSADDLQVPVALNPALHETLIAAEAELIDADKIHVTATPLVKSVDPGGIAHISYAFKGVGRGVLLNCPAGHATLLVHFHVRSETPVVE